jgi:hypothetical protein
MIKQRRITQILALICAALFTNFSAIHTARAAVAPTTNALNLAIAMSVEPALIRGAAFVTQPPAVNGISTAIVDQPVGGFPRAGGSFVAMSTGKAAQILRGTGYPSANLGGTPKRGNTDYDVTILRLDLTVPTGRNCIAFDVQFFTLDNPLSVGLGFNDAFIAEWDTSNWSTNNGIVNAPNNFALDSRGRMLSIDGTGQTIASANASDTNFAGGGGTPLTRVAKPVTAGNHSLYLSLFDQTDLNADAAVFLDNLTIFAQNGSNCVSPAPLKPDTVGIYKDNVFYLRGSNTTGPADAVIAFGSPGYLPVTGDWNGDGIDTIGVFDPQSARFYLRNSNTPGAPDYVFVFGDPGDRPLSGRWDNTMTGSGIGVYRPSTGRVYLKRTLSSGNPDYTIYLGTQGSGKSVFGGDWDGDGFDSIGYICDGCDYPNTYLSNSITSFFSPAYSIFSATNDYGGVAYAIPGDWFGQGYSTIGGYEYGIAYLHTSLNYYAKRAVVSYGAGGWETQIVAGKWGLPASAPPLIESP